MSSPRFAIGQSVSVAYSKRYPGLDGAYRIIAAMPNDNGPTRYRIKGELEKFERVIDEAHLGEAEAQFSQA